MGSSKFANRLESRVPRTGIEDRRKVIGKIMARGGIVRRVLTDHSIEADTYTWQGRSGMDVADDLLTVAESIGGLPAETRERIAHLADRFAAAETGYRMRLLDDHTEVS
jgi:hypothetical protein